MTRDRTYLRVIRSFRLVFRLMGLRFRIEGVENIPATGGAVLACNHLSYLDFTFVGLAARRRRRLVRFLAKESTFHNRVSGPLMRSMRHIPVDRDNGAPAALRALHALRAGELVGVFPEATISRTWTLKSFKAGAAALALWADVPLVPVVLWAPQRTFTVDRHYSLRRGKTIMIMVGEPVDVPAGATREQVGELLKTRMRALLEHAWRAYPDVPRDAADSWWVPRELGGDAMTQDEATAREDAAVLRRRARRQR